MSSLVLVLLFILLAVYVCTSWADGTYTYSPHYSPPPTSRSCPTWDIDHFSEENVSLATLLQFGEMQVYDDIGESTAETTDERFAAAKRTVPENRMRTGILTSKERRKQLDAIIRRVGTTKLKNRPRRNEKDFALLLRGDNIPKRENEWTINKPRFGADSLEKGILSCKTGVIPISVTESSATE